MSDETTKTRVIRGPDFAKTYLQGRVIDIGCGADLIAEHAEPFDVQHGDAQEIGSLRENGAYDAVCSSHCLEHMRDVPRALQQWWSLVREGGCLIIVVPDEDLYEQGGWPSLFNSDHKATFRFQKDTSWSPVSFDIKKLIEALPGAELICCELQNQGYDDALRRSSISARNRALFHLSQYWAGLCRRLHCSGTMLEKLISAALIKLGSPVDQTAGAALAQIQVIARKRGESAGKSERKHGDGGAI